MSVEPELLALFTDRITVRSAGATDLYGRDADGAARIVDAFIEREPRLVQSREGRQIISNATIYLDDVAIGPNDKLFYEDGTEANVVSLVIPRDENGPHHTEASVE